MRTKHLILLPHWIETDSLRTWWHENCQMAWYEERKDGILIHGDFKGWSSDGRLGWHNIYENGNWVKRIV